MRTDIENLRREDREARRNSVYSHPNSVRQREAAKRSVSPNDIGPRQADERASLGLRHHEAGQKLAQAQRVEMDRHRATNQPMPADLPKKHAEARKQLTEKHEHEREQLREKHLLQRAEQRRRGTK